MGLPKSKNAVGLGNSLMNDRFGKGKGGDRKKVSAAGNKGVVRVNHATGEEYVTNAAQEASWVKMRSVTEQGALDEFLSTAELAGTDFTAEKMNNVKIIHTDQRNPYLLSVGEERGVRRKQAANRARLTVPRRPKWNENTTAIELDEMERAALLEWRRGLAELQEHQDLLMTPFERNIEVWRQLWRVIERSDLVVQIVDARNPLMFRSEDLERYVKEVNPRKRNLLLVNKADMMTEAQREKWADYFEEKKINYKFFSAHLAKEMNEAGLEDDDHDDDDNDDDDDNSNVDEDSNDEEDEDEADEEEDSSEDDEDEDVSEPDETQDPIAAKAASTSPPATSNPTSNTTQSTRTQILTVDELESLFLENIPSTTTTTDSSLEEQSDGATNNKRTITTTIGLVGYPNVGKSSTINALIGAKKVSVSATPGKTKHFQTIHLSPKVILCDCPGLVFPNFATTKAELVCNGVLPIDQLREFTGPAGLVAQRVPKPFLESVYGMQIRTRPAEEGGSGIPTASEMLRAYARARGFATSGRHGAPDESRAARYILKDYVNGKLLYCHPPPSLSNPLEEGPVTGKDFNKGLYDFAHLPAKRQAWLLSHNNTNEDISALNNDNEEEDEEGEEEEENIDPTEPSSSSLTTTTTTTGGKAETGSKSKSLDQSFFLAQERAKQQQRTQRGNTGHIVSQAFNAAYTDKGQALAAQQQRLLLLDAAESQRGKELTGRKEKMMLALEKGVDVGDLSLRGKKHFKGARKKTRRGKVVGVEDD